MLLHTQRPGMREGARVLNVEADVLSESEEAPQRRQRFSFVKGRNTKVNGDDDQIGRNDPEKALQEKLNLEELQKPAAPVFSTPTVDPAALAMPSGMEQTKKAICNQVAAVENKSLAIIEELDEEEKVFFLFPST